jgi:60 kDa SS-A/Ro ribonucleoprotein
VGNQPSLADIVKMVHPKPGTPDREAFFGWLVGKPFDAKHLPACVQSLLDWRSGSSDTLPETAFDLLTDRPLTTKAWSSIARRASWQWTRMNLATLSRHGVLKDEAMVDLVASRLRDSAQIAKARVFPYQLLMAWKSMGMDMPSPIRDALQDALEIAVDNVPAFEGRVVVCPDVSGSMHSPVTGFRGTARSAVRCVDVAALIAAALLRRNPTARVMPFKESVVDLDLNPRDSIVTNAQRMASVGAGGTDCSAPLRALNAASARADLVVFVSDNESWMDAQNGRGTATMQQWERFRIRNPKARLVCIDLTPNRTSQAQSREDILNIGGFSDQVFHLLGEFAAGRMQGRHWEGHIETEGMRLMSAA